MLGDIMRKVLAIAAALFLTAPALAEDDSPKPAAPQLEDRYFPVSAVRPGMRGHGLTVKAGTKIERFEVEVIDVMRNNLVKQDIILVRCLGKAFADHGIAQGMSGSPIYFRDRLAGALSYTWAWSKHAIGGVTPIEAMLPEGKRKLEGRPTGAAPATPLRRARRIDKRTKFRPIGTPLMVNGFSEDAGAALRERFAQDGWAVGVGAPADAAAGGLRNLDASAEPGASVVVDLMRGDFGVSALGTITHVDGNAVYAFGHSFDTLGETLLPASLGYVYTVLASRNLSNKMGGRLREIGAVVQDRPSCIVVRKDMKAPMVPFTLRFRNAQTKREETFKFEVTPNTLYFQVLLRNAISSAFAKAESTLGPNTKRFTMTVKMAGMEPWSYEDIVAGFDGGFARVLMGLVDKPLNHPSLRPAFESFNLDVEVEHRDRRAFIKSAVASHDEVRPGQQISVLVGLEMRDGGKRVFERMDVTIPSDAPTGNLVIALVAGDLVPPEVPNYTDIADLPKLFAAYLKATDLVAVVPTSRVDVDVFGNLLRRVPLSLLPRLARSPGGADMQLQPVTEKVVRNVPYVVTGSQQVTVRVVR